MTEAARAGSHFPRKLHEAPSLTGSPPRRFAEGIQGVRLAARSYDISPRIPELSSYRKGCDLLSVALATAHVFKFDAAASSHATQLSLRPDLLADRLHAFELPFEHVLVEMDNAASYEVRTGRCLAEDAPPWSGFLASRLTGEQRGCIITSIGPADGSEQLYGVAPFSYVVHPHYYGINQSNDLVLKVSEQYLMMAQADPADGLGDDPAKAGSALVREMEEAMATHSEVSTQPRLHGALMAWLFGANLGFDEQLLHAVRLIEHTAVLLNKFTGLSIKELWESDPHAIAGSYSWDHEHIRRKPQELAAELIAHDLKELCGDYPRALGALLALDSERRRDAPALVLDSPRRPPGRQRRGAASAPFCIEQTVRLRLDAPPIPPRPATGFGSRQKQHTRRGHWCYQHKGRDPLLQPNCPTDLHQWETVEPPPPEGVNHRQLCRLCNQLRWHRREYLAGDPRLGTIITNYEVTP